MIKVFNNWYKVGIQFGGIHGHPDSSRAGTKTSLNHICYARPPAFQSEKI
jgi:hypothetical protein